MKTMEQKEIQTESSEQVECMLCARIEELEKEKLELNEELDIAQQERDNYQHQFARAAEVLGEIHEALNGSGPAIVGMEAVQVRQLKGERDALAAHVEEAEFTIGEWRSGTFGDTAAAMNLEAWRVSCPETSLARLKAQWQAEALQELHSTWKSEGMMRVGALLDKAIELQEEAEGGEV